MMMSTTTTGEPEHKYMVTQDHHAAGGSTISPSILLDAPVLATSSASNSVSSSPIPSPLRTVHDETNNTFLDIPHVTSNPDADTLGTHIQVEASPMAKTKKFSDGFANEIVHQKSQRKLVAKAALYEESKINDSLLSNFSATSATTDGTDGDEDDDDDDDEREIPTGILHPHSTFSIAWTAISVVFAVYTVITVSFRWTFWNDCVDVDSVSMPFIIIDAVCDLFFIIDIIINFRMAFKENNVMIYDADRIKQRYIRGWLAFDIGACIPLDLVQLSTLSYCPWVRAPKLLRCFRIIHFFHTFDDRFTSFDSSLSISLLKLLFYTLFFSHFFACLKYLVLEESPFSSTRLEPYTIFGRYLQSLYWSMGSIVSRDDINAPDSFVDILFTVIMMIIGIVWFAYIIASVDQFADVATSNTRFQVRVKYVSNFMNAYSVPIPIQNKVKSYYSYLWSSSLRFETDQFLQRLPSALQNDARLFLASSVLMRSEIFQDVEEGVISYLVSHLTVIVAVPNEVIIRAESSGTEMFFIQEGEVEILIGQKQANIATLRSGDYFGEYALFFSKVRTSTARAKVYSTLLVLAKSQLLRGLSLFPNAERIVRETVMEHRARTLQQEQNLLSLDSSAAGRTGGDEKKQAALRRNTTKLAKLVNVEESSGMMKKQAHWTMNPSSNFYKRWQWVYLFFIIYNAIMVPVRFGFRPGLDSVTVLLLDYVGDAFFIADMCLSFRLSYIDKGQEVTDLKSIRTRYLSSWFILHVVSSLPLDFIMLIHQQIEVLYRLNHCLRLIHAHSILTNMMKDSTHYEIMSLVYFFCAFLTLSHWSSCIYWSFTRFEGFSQSKTGEALDGTNDDQWQPAQFLADQNFVYQYLRAQYYAACFLVGIGRHIYPPSDADVLLTLSLMIVGVFVVSYLIGKVGHLMFHLNASASEFKQEANYFTQLMHYRHMPAELQSRVHRYLTHTWNIQKGIDPNAAMKNLPFELRADIMMHICESLINSVPFIRALDIHFHRQLVGELIFCELPAHEFVCRQGQIGEHMYFIESGICEIIIENLSTSSTFNVSSDGSYKLKVIGAGSFFGEGAMFNGRRSATIRTRTACKLLVLNAASFKKIMMSSSIFAKTIRQLNTERLKKIQGIITVCGVKKIEGAEKKRTSIYANSNHNNSGNNLVKQAMSEKEQKRRSSSTRDKKLENGIHNVKTMVENVSNGGNNAIITNTSSSSSSSSSTTSAASNGLPLTSDMNEGRKPGNIMTAGSKSKLLQQHSSSSSSSSSSSGRRHMNVVDDDKLHHVSTAFVDMNKPQQRPSLKGAGVQIHPSSSSSSASSAPHEVVIHKPSHFVGTSFASVSMITLPSENDHQHRHKQQDQSVTK